MRRTDSSSSRFKKTPKNATLYVGIAKDPRGLDLRGILSGLGSSAIDARDRLLLALGFAAALRRSELVGLDWKRQGTGDGYLMQDHRGIVITLLSTKGGKGEPVEVIVPCEDMPTACDALDEWAAIGGLEPGQPVFLALDKAQRSLNSIQTATDTWSDFRETG